MTDILTRQLKGVLENAIFTKILALNTNISNSTLRAVVSRVAEIATIELVGSVNKNANFQLNSIPQNLIGNFNPVNLVTGNLSSNSLSNNLSNVLDVQITAQLTDKVVGLLDRELKVALPVDKYNLINFSSLAATLVQSLAPSISSAVGTALKSFTDGVFNTGKTITPIISNVEGFFSGSSGSDQALEKITENYTTVNANKYLQQSKAFDVNNEANQEKLAVLSKGFTDPNANYPTKEYKDRPDTNKLATGDITGGTVVQNKNKERMLGAKLPGGESWDEPVSAYKAEYPYNKVTETESGHILEIDDTPGAERMHLFHRAGTYVEIDSNGSMVRRIRGSSYEIIDRNGKISISGRADISINGACNIFVGNDANIEVDGDTNLTCHNDITAQAGGNVNISARETLNLTGNSVNIQAYTDFDITAGTVLNLHSTQDTSILSNTEVSIHASEAVNLHSNTEITVQAVDLYTKVSGSAYHETGSNYHVKAGSSIYNQPGSDFHVNAGSGVNIDSGSDINLNSGTSSSATGSKDGKIGALSGVSLIGILSSRRDIVYETFEDPSPLTLADNYTLDVEEEKQSTEEQKAHRDKLVLNGMVEPEVLDRNPVEQESITVESTQNTTVPGAESLKNVTALPGNYNLSPNFTLEMLTTKAAITKDAIETSEFTYGEIVFNLQQVALNILEPVYNLYPNAFVTSGYRQRAKSSKTSQHPTGCAVDIQFKGAAKSDYYEIAKRLAKVLKYDQLLLEYSAYTNNPWIHISYTGQQDRTQVLTFWNHKTYSQGLTQLA